MKFNKCIIALAALFALVLSANAQYSRYDGTTVVIAGGTNYVAAATTNTYAVAIDVTRQSYIGVQVVGVASGANSGTLLLNFSKSVDGATYETSPSVTVKPTMNGATAICYVGTSQVDGYGWLRLDSIANTNATYITNIAVKVSIKR